MGFKISDLFGAGDVAKLGDHLLEFTERIIPDKTAAAKEAAALQEKILGLDAAGAQAQMDVNKIEAANPSLFVAGWRPAVGWIGAVSLALMYWPKAIVLSVFWCIAAYHSTRAGTPLPEFPSLGTEDMVGILGSMLGMAAARSYEKTKGVSTTQIGGK
jgi:hypothetical protein